VPETVSAHARSRPLADILIEIKDEILDFAETRIRLFHSEYRATLQSLKGWFPLAITAVGLLATAYVLVMAAIVSLVSFAFLNSPFRWPLAFLMVAGLWLAGGLVAAGLARSEFRRRGSFPEKSLAVLKKDGLWLKEEARHRA
jgi:uncharacterized integral membrane protein